MTRKRFWGLRNALNVRLNEWAKKNGGVCPSGVSDKALRPVKGKPLLNFDLARKNGWPTSYDGQWNSPEFKSFRQGLGM